MSGIEICNICKKVKLPGGQKETIFDNFSMTINMTGAVGLFGPNGCGKTTLLNMIAGISKPDSGEIFIYGKKPSESTIAYVVQDYRSALFPWLSIKDNILFPLTVKKRSKTERSKRFDYLQELFGIPFNINKYPYQLSGGQQQYVSILRCFISNPSIMLVDEPFSSLDYSSCIWLMEKMASVFKTTMIPVIMVDHDVNHLVSLTKKIYFLSNKPTCVIFEETNFSQLNLEKDTLCNKKEMNVSQKMPLLKDYTICGHL